MAQLLLESASVVSKVSSTDSSENSGPVTVHGMLEQPLIAQYEAAPVLDDSDVFQCGRCKKQFSSIDIFVNHKTECNNSGNQVSDISLSANVSGIPQNAVVVQKIEVPSSSFTSYPQSLILNENEILQFTQTEVNNIATAAVTNSGIQISPNSLIHQQVGNVQTGPAQIHQVLHQLITTNDSQGSQIVELSVLDDKFLSRPVILQHGNAVQNLVLNISSPSHPQTIICTNPESDKTSESVPESISEPAIINENEQIMVDKGTSTVNIINEFHSSMVKTKKPSNENENEENQVRKDYEKLNCAYCWKSFTKNFDLQQHIRVHTGEKPFQCIVCGRAFAQKSNVKKHMQTHKVWPDGLAKTLPPLPSKNSSSSNGNVSQDSNCSDSPADQNDNVLQKERSAEFNKCPYLCPYCKYIAKNYYKLKSHMKQHDTEKVYKCIVSSCGQMFNDLDPFLEHTKSHENEMTYRCHECNKNFPSLFDLGTHQLTHAVNQNMKSQNIRRYFQCNLCLNKYSTPAALDHHLATSSHTYSCTLCDKVFTCERYLRRHLQIHSEVEAYTCNVCKKGFRTESYLKVHMIVHSEAKPFECTTCQAAFNRKDKLKRHLLIHETVKRFKCPFRSRGCLKEFNRLDKLKSHVLTHSCIKPFNCKICGRSFTRKSHLRDHIKQNHEESDLKLLEEFEKSDDNSGKEGDSEKSNKCKKQSTSKKRKTHSGNSRTRRQRKKVQNLKRPKRAKYAKIRDLLKLNSSDDSSKDSDIDSVSGLADDIPTAHIEIISANGTLVPGSDLTHISLGSDMNYGDLQFDTGVVTDVPNGSPISVEAIDTSNSNSLLASELHHSTDISDFS